MSEVVTSLADPSANVIFGAVIDDQVGLLLGAAREAACSPYRTSSPHSGPLRACMPSCTVVSSLHLSDMCGVLPPSCHPFPHSSALQAPCAVPRRGPRDHRHRRASSLSLSPLCPLPPAPPCAVRGRDPRHHHRHRLQPDL